MKTKVIIEFFKAEKWTCTLESALPSKTKARKWAKAQIKGEIRRFKFSDSCKVSFN